MLFNSYVFIFAFLPITLAGFFLLGRHRLCRLAIAWVTAASLFYYGWWNFKYLALIGTSVIFNYVVGFGLGHWSRTPPGKALTILGVVGNLGLLGYFKYTNFFINNLNAALGTSLHLQQIVLPLGISFFTFQQIAYLVDAYRGETKEYNFMDYCLFVCFFPQLIAGPIVHHKEMLPQFTERRIFRFSSRDFAIGMTIFTIGLFKKVVLADGVAVYSTRVFDMADNGVAIGCIKAWGAALAYTFQIYFDFSGYSDMAIGLGRMFGIVLPLNFHSPYRAVNIIEFWRRWHMTLSRFLRDYLYFTLGGNRRGPTRRFVNLFLTMLLGGLWHGAGWTFVIWGGLHGVYLIVNHGWRGLCRKLGRNLDQPTRVGTVAARCVTFFAVVTAWVFFRANSLSAATTMFKAMAQFGEIASLGVADLMSAARQLMWTGGLLCVVWLLPNTQQIMARIRPALGYPRAAGESDVGPCWWHWRPTIHWAVAVSALFLVAVMHLCKITEFLYFQF